MFNKSVLVNLCALFVLGTMTYAIKQKVIDLDNELMSVQREIVHHQESMHILQAEWSYLTRPSRLQALVDDHLHMNQSRGLSLVSYDEVFARDEEYGKCEYHDPLRLASASITPVQKPSRHVAQNSRDH